MVVQFIYPCEEQRFITVTNRRTYCVVSEILNGMKLENAKILKN